MGRAAASGRTLVMGILNVTPDSFSDGGRWQTPDEAIAHGLELVSQGADIIDVGGESTRPGSRRLDPQEETARIEPVVTALAQEGCVVSVDTINAATALAALQAGAAIVNDVSGGLADPGMHPLVTEAGVVYVCQHMRGTPETMETLTDYPQGVLAGVAAELVERLGELDAAGVERSQVVLDPGLGFAKTQAQSWELLAATARLRQRFNLPVLIGSSRKRFLGEALSLDARDQVPTEPSARDVATAATTALAAAAGAWAVRVHDVPLNRDAVRTAALWKEHS